MKRLKISFLFALLFILAVGLILPLNAESKTTTVNDYSSEKIFPDSSGGFFVTQTKGANFQLLRTNRKHDVLVYKFDSSYVTNHLMLNDNSYIVIYTDTADVRFSYIYAYNKDRSLFEFSFGDYHIKENCLAVDENDNVYFVADNDDKIICIFDVNGRIKNSIHFNQPIKALYQDGNYNIYIITENSIIPLNDLNRRINSNSPNTPFELYDDVCIDSGGNVYTFDKSHGFSLNNSIKCDNLFIADGSFYQYDDNCIYKLTDEGKRTAKYECSDKIADIASSGNNIGVITNGTAVFISTDKFKPISENSKNNNSDDNTNSSNSSTDSNNSRNNNNNNNSDNSSGSQNNTTSNSGSNSSGAKNDFKCAYTLSNDGYIYDISQGTTIAAVKKNITGDGVALTFRNKDGETVKSGKLGSGYTIGISNGEASDTYCVVIVGDVTGEGNINSRDISSLTNYLLGENENSEWFLKASDINGDCEVNSIDLLLMKRTV